MGPFRLQVGLKSLVLPTDGPSDRESPSSLLTNTMWIIIITLALIYILHKSIRLYQYRALARSLGLPYYTFPVSETNIFYLALFETRLVPYLISTWLPRNLADYLYASSFKYCWTVKDRLLRRYGGVYAVASPAGIFWQVSDAEVAGQVCRNRRGFPKPTERYGRCIICASFWVWLIA